MNNKEKFLQLVDKSESNTIEKAKERKENRTMLRESQIIASKILIRLDELDWTHEQFAKKMAISPYYVNKILRGKENLTLDTLVRLQEILNIALLASFSEDAIS